MVLADTEKAATNGRGNILELVQPRSISDAPEGPKPSDDPPQAAPAPKGRPGRPPGSKNKPKPGAKAKASPAKVPAKKATKKRPAKKVAAQKETKVAQRAAAKVAERQAAAEAGDVNAPEHLAKIQRAFGKYNRAKANKAEVGKQCGEQLKAAEAAFTNAVEAPLDASRVETDAYRTKLQNVEQRWQELSETKAGNIEEKKLAREKFKEAQENLARVIENSAQVEMFDDK